MWTRGKPGAPIQLFFRFVFSFILLLLVTVPIQAQGWKTTMVVPEARVLASGTVNFTECYTARNSGTEGWYKCSDQNLRHRLNWDAVWPQVHRDVDFHLNEPGQVYIIFTSYVDKTWPYSGISAAISKAVNNGSWQNVLLGSGMRLAFFRGENLVDTSPRVSKTGPPPVTYRIGADGKIQFYDSIPHFSAGQYRLILTEAMFHNMNTADKTYHPSRGKYKLLFVPDRPVASVGTPPAVTPVPVPGTVHSQAPDTWAVNQAGNVYQLNQKWGWTPRLGEKAQDIGVGADGSTWIVGTSPVYGGYIIYRWTANGYVRVDGGAVRIDVDANGRAWVVNSMNDIYRWLGDHWKRMPGKAVDIGIGANGSVFIIGTNRTAGGYGIYHWNGSSWNPIPGAAVRIDVDASGNPWVVNDAGVISRWNGSGWNQLPGQATDISVGRNNAWVIGTGSVPGGHDIYKWNNQTQNWEQVPGGAVAISVGGFSHHSQTTSNIHSPRAGLKSGQYKVKVWVGGTLYNSTWFIKVENGNITGLSKWPCCPNDPLRGKLTGDTVMIQRDCAGQGWNRGRIQTYTGTLNGNRIQGTATGTGLTGYKTTWTLFLDSEGPLKYGKR